MSGPRWLVVDYLCGGIAAGRQISRNFDTAWAGFDVMLIGVLAATGYFALRRSRYLSTAATAAAALLVVDAWFDVIMTPPDRRLQSILLAAAVELPLASVCIWLSYHAQQLAERRIVLLQRRRRRPEEVGDPAHMITRLPAASGDGRVTQELTRSPASTTKVRQGR